MENYKTIFGFINENRIHWTCFLINTQDNTILYLDPQGENEQNKDKLLNNWKNFCKSIPVFLNKKWKIETINHSIQRDSNNCGVYVCQFLKLLLKGKELFFEDSPDDLKKLREEINLTFKKNSLKNYCSFCGNTLNIEEEMLSTNCNHHYHANCSAMILKSKLNFYCPLCF